MQYASSSMRVVRRLAAQDMRCATLVTAKCDSRVSTCFLMPVMCSSSAESTCLSPRTVHSLERKSTVAGAISSCSVHPRVCQRARRKAESGGSKGPSLGTSSRWA